MISIILGVSAFAIGSSDLPGDALGILLINGSNFENQESYYLLSSKLAIPEAVLIVRAAFLLSPTLCLNFSSF